MISNSVINILSLFRRQPTLLLSIREISKRLDKPYPFIYKHVNDLIHQNILKKITVGRSHLCTINYESLDVLPYLALQEHAYLKELGKHNAKINLLRDFFNQERILDVQSILYDTKNNDLCFIANSVDVKAIQKSLSKTVFDGAVQIHNATNFKDLLSKELFEDHMVIVFGASNFHFLIGKYIEQVKLICGQWDNE